MYSYSYYCRNAQTPGTFWTAMLIYGSDYLVVKCTTGSSLIDFHHLPLIKKLFTRGAAQPVAKRNAARKMCPANALAVEKNIDARFVQGWCTYMGTREHMVTSISGSTASDHQLFFLSLTHSHPRFHSPFLSHLCADYNTTRSALYLCVGAREIDRGKSGWVSFDRCFFAICLLARARCRVNECRCCCRVSWERFISQHL